MHRRAAMGKRAGQWAALVCLAVLLFPLTAWAKPVPWEITADTLIHYDNPKAIFAEGNVVLVRPKEAGPPLTITADWMRYDVELGLVKARGHVFIDSPGGEEVRADVAKLDLNTQVGTMGNATIFVAENNLYIKGKEVEKTGELTYTLHESRISACEPVPGKSQAWAIESSRAKITVDGMTHLINPRLEVKDVPVVYSPYMVVPTKTKRETGFLFPEWGFSSRDGFSLTAPFFINLSPSSDITLYPSYMAERGMMYGGEFRYAAGPRSQGLFMLNYLRDDLADTDNDEYRSDGLIRDAQNRYWLRGKADHQFSETLVGRLDLDYVSDADFLQEFDKGSFGYSKNHQEFQREFRRTLQEKSLTTRESTAQLIKSWGDMVLSGELRTLQDVGNDLILSANDGDGTLEAGEVAARDKSISPLQTLPRLDFTGRIPIGGRRLNFAWDTEYVNYWRERGVGAHRLDLHPQFITPLPRGGWVEGKVTTGIRETAYEVQTNKNANWAYDTFQERTAFDFEGNVATLLMRDFDLSFGEAQWLEHTMRPNLIYSYVSRTSEAELPSLDGVDRLAYGPRNTIKNWLTYEWNNYVDIGGDGGGEKFWNRQLALFKVLQTYDLRENRIALTTPGDKRREFSDVRFDLQAYPWAPLLLRYQTNVSVYGQGVTRYELMGRYTTPWKSSFSLDYRYLRHSGMVEPYFYTTSGESQHDLLASFNAPLTATLTGYGSINKSFSTDHTVESILGLSYKPDCWVMEVEMRRSTDGEQGIMVIFSLDGIGRAFRLGKEDLL
ncbi:MAG TPA: LPS assembly protein LptD [Desulfurivibrionaceae bacterium]|nr:LPS assembly protein LptD [Desulfurivibrionaceae bacterium]